MSVGEMTADDNNSKDAGRYMQAIAEERKQILMTIKDCAAYLGISVRSVARIISGKKIGHHRVGRLIKISRKDADRYLDSTYVPPRW